MRLYQIVKENKSILTEDALDWALEKLLFFTPGEDATAADVLDILMRIMNSPDTDSFGDVKRLLATLENGYENDQLIKFRDTLQAMEPNAVYFGSDLQKQQVARAEYNATAEAEAETAVADTAGETDTGDGSNDEVEMEPGTGTAVADTAGETDTGDGSNDEVEMEPGTGTAEQTTQQFVDNWFRDNPGATEKDFIAAWQANRETWPEHAPMSSELALAHAEQSRNKILAGIDGTDTGDGSNDEVEMEPGTNTAVAGTGQIDILGVGDQDDVGILQHLAGVKPDGGEEQVATAPKPADTTMGDKQQAMPTGDEQAAAIKTTLAARREAMKQAWLKNDPSLVTHPDDVKKVNKLWSDRAGGFTSGGPPRIAGEEPDLLKYAQGYRINQDTGKWEKKPGPPKGDLTARREAMKQAWLKNDPSLVTHPSDVAKVKKLWNDRAGGFTSGGPPRIAGEEPNLGKWAKGQNINLKTGEWEDNPERVKNPGETKREKLKRQRAEQEKKEMNADR